MQTHLCALMTYRTAADLLAQMFPVDAGAHHETLRHHTLKVGEALGEGAAIRPEAAAPSIVVTLDSTFIRSCDDSERHLEVRVGNVEAVSGGRQVFGAVAKADTDLQALIHCNLDAVGKGKDVNRLATVTPPNFQPSALTRISKLDFGWGHYRRRL